MSITSDLKWGYGASRNRNSNTVKVKQEKTKTQKNKLTKDPSSVASSYSKKSRHSSARKIQVGNLVTAKIGAQSKEKTASGKHSQAKEPVYCTVTKSIGNNLYWVSFDNGDKRKTSSRQLTKPPLSNVEEYYKMLDSLFNIKGSDKAHSTKRHTVKDSQIVADSSHHSNSVNQSFNKLPSADTNPLFDNTNLKEGNHDDTQDEAQSILPFTQMDATRKKSNSNTKNSHAQASNPTKQDNRSNKARKEIDQYEKQLKAAIEKIIELADEEQTYQVSSSNDTMEWTMIHEWLNFQHIPKRQPETLGIKDKNRRDMIKILTIHLLNCSFTCYSKMENGKGI